MTHTHRHHRLSALGGTLGGLPSLKCLHPWQNNTIHRWSHTGCCGGRSTVGHTSLRRMVLTWRACTTLFWNLNSSLLSPKEPDRQNFTNALKSEPSGRKKALKLLLNRNFILKCGIQNQTEQNCSKQRVGEPEAPPLRHSCSLPAFPRDASSLEPYDYTA